MDAAEIKKILDRRNRKKKNKPVDFYKGDLYEVEEANYSYKYSYIQKRIFMILKVMFKNKDISRSYMEVCDILTNTHLRVDLIRASKHVKSGVWKKIQN